MRIAATQFNLKNQALEIYLSGCKGHCKNCHNPELKDFSIGDDMYDVIDKIVVKCHRFDIIKSIWILGGEPLDQDLGELACLIHELEYAEKELWLFTRYEIDQIPLHFRNKFTYIKTGPYDETKKKNHTVYDVELATSNQTVLKRGVNF